MCQCVSRWRPAEVDGLAFGRRRRRSVALGTRSVMEDGVTGRPERRGNDTEHAVAATERPARRFPSDSPLGLSPRRVASRRAAERSGAERMVPLHNWRDGSTALPSLRPRIVPYLRPRSHFSSTSSSSPHARGRTREIERKRGSEGGMEIGEPPRATLEACMLPSQCTGFDSWCKIVRSLPFLIFLNRRASQTLL